ncbi:hypothetical protein [Sanguibacter antarcticus]|nr:hypothetical protein [Sanguibacter antarcticus]
MTRTSAKFVLFALGAALVAVAWVMFTRIGDVFGTTLFDTLVKDHMDFRPPTLLISTLALAVLGVAVVVFAAGMKRSHHDAVEISVARADVMRAFLVLGSAMAALVGIIFAVVPGEVGRTLLTSLADPFPSYPSIDTVVSMLGLIAAGASSLVVGAQMRRSSQTVSAPAMTRGEAERALLIFGSAHLALAVVLLTLVTDGMGRPLLDSWGSGSTSDLGVVEAIVLSATIAAALLGTALLACGARMKARDHTTTRADVERAGFVVGSALVALAVLRLVLVHDVMGSTLLEAVANGSTGYAPSFLRDSTITLAAVGIGIIAIAATMRADRRRGRTTDRSAQALVS